MGFGALEKRNKALKKNVKAFNGDTTVEPQRKATIPDPIVFATEGVHVAVDKKHYTITYERKEEIQS